MMFAVSAECRQVCGQGISAGCHSISMPLCHNTTCITHMYISTYKLRTDRVGAHQALAARALAAWLQWTWTVPGPRAARPSRRPAAVRRSRPQAAPQRTPQLQSWRTSRPSSQSAPRSRERTDGLSWQRTSLPTSRPSKPRGGAGTRCKVKVPVTRTRSRTCQGASHTRPGVARPGGRRSWEEGCSHVPTPEGFTLCSRPRQGARGPGAGGRQGAALARRERAAQGQLHPAALQPAAPAGREGPPGAARGGRQAGGGRQAARRRPGRRQGGPELGKAGQSVRLGWNRLGLERGWDWAWRRPDQGLGNAGPSGAQRCRRGQACWLSSLADGPLLSLYVRCVPMCHQAAA
jgi:hypothetical protein